MTKQLELTIRNIRTRSVVVPMDRPLVTRIVTIESAALLLIDLETNEGITGRRRTSTFGRSICAPVKNFGRQNSRPVDTRHRVRIWWTDASTW